MDVLDIHIVTQFILVYAPQGNILYKVGMLTHLYSFKPLKKIKVTICNYQSDCQFHLRHDVLFGDLQT